MMRRIVFFCLLLVFPFIIGLAFVYQENSSSSTYSPRRPTSSAPIDHGVSKKQTSLFVPYWGMQAATLPVGTYDRFIYFGITTTKTGLDTKEIGYTRLPQFLQKSQGVNSRYLTLRMINSEINSAVLDDPKAQRTIAKEIASLAKEHDFDGVLWDFELSSLYFESVVKKITTFEQVLAEEVKAQNMQFAIALYGDVFFRARPYNVEVLAQEADEVMVMAYDFHKSRGNPGPNFPLSGKEDYGYDFQTMMTDFTEVVPKQKITVIFGFFGYDWIVDDQKRTIEVGVPLGLVDMQEQFLSNCLLQNCRVRRDTTSAEYHVTYRDSEGKEHQVWFEDEQSAKQKQGFLTQMGINSIAYWAYSYF